MTTLPELAPTRRTTSRTTTPHAVVRPGARRGAPAPRHRQGDDLSGLVAAVGRWYWEVLDGRRDPRQLGRLLTPACEVRVRAAVTERHRERRTGSSTPAAVTGTRALTARWNGDTCEGVALVTRNGRCTAVTVVAQVRNGRIRVVDVARPEGCQPALRPPRD